MRDSVIGIGVVGAGRWGTHHARVFSTLPKSRVVAVCDSSREAANALARDVNAEASFADHRELLEHPGIDAVSVATPDFAHAAVILDALAAGKHVLTEKPLSTDVREAEAIKAAADGTDLVLMVDFHNRVSPAFAAARQEIASGAIGKPVHVSARLSNSVEVPLEMLSWSAKSSALWFLGSHLVDILRFLLEDEVARVFAVSGEGVLQARGVDTKDFHLSILEFRGGPKAIIENSWILSKDNPMIFDFKVELVGTAGQLMLNPSHSGSFQKLDGSGLSYQDMFGIAPAGRHRIGGFVQESIARFLDALDGAPLLASAEDGLAATRVLHSIELSAATGLPVDVG